MSLGMETKNLAAAMSEVKRMRVLAGIPGRLLCLRASVDRGRLSALERGYTLPSADEVEPLRRALDHLITAKEKVDRYASEVGWPQASLKSEV
jgi:hypothetical protein